MREKMFVWAGLLVLLGSASAIPLQGVLQVTMPGGGAWVDSLYIRFSSGDDTIPTPGWGIDLPGTVTFDFPQVPSWPTGMLLHYRSGGVSRQHILYPERETWYNLPISSARVKFTDSPGVADLPGAGLPAGAFRVSPSVINRRAVFSLSLPGSVGAVLELFGAGGGLVRRFDFPAGTRTLRWDATDASGARLPEGAYFYRLRSETGSLTGKLLIVR